MWKPAENHPWRVRRGTFDCPAECENRKPGCHSSCEQYKARKAAYEERKKVVDQQERIDQYSCHEAGRVKNFQAKRAKNMSGYKKVRNW